MKYFIRILYISAFLVLASFNTVNTKAYKVQKIVIDPGHGGKDPGTCGKFSKEKDITLKIALKLGEIIKKNFKNVKIIYTRKKDTFVTLHERACIANKNNADVFISIHCNATSSKYVCGTETYVMGLHTSAENLAVAKRENKVILMEQDYKENYQDFDPNALESHILFSLYQNAHNENSLQLAQNIEYQFKNKVGRKSLGVKQAGFLVLCRTSLPSVLVEVGFLTHRQEEKYLNSSIGQSYVAAGIFRALRDYKTTIETAS